MMDRATVVGTLIAGVCLAVPGTVRAQQDILKAGGVDDAAVAAAYYQTIDPNDERLTQDAWEEVNGFNDPMNQVIVAKGYFNNGDLSYFRSIEMVKDRRPGYQGNIAFTTVNYATEADALAEVNKISIVNMEYSPGPDGDRIVKFYVFSPDGARQLSTTFDRRGEELYLPAACFSCHGGTDSATSPLPPGGYNGGSGETGAAFLAFDINTMTFSADVPRASLEAAFKEFNKAVLRTNPTSATRTLINGLYGGAGLPSATQVDYLPASWVEEEELYRQVVVPSCQLCHTVSDSKVLSLEWWKSNTSAIREEVFHEQRMPNSLPSHERFWAGNQPDILLDALERFENP